MCLSRCGSWPGSVTTLRPPPSRGHLPYWVRLSECWCCAGTADRIADPLDVLICFSCCRWPPLTETRRPPAWARAGGRRVADHRLTLAARPRPETPCNDRRKKPTCRGVGRGPSVTPFVVRAADSQGLRRGYPSAKEVGRARRREEGVTPGTGLTLAAPRDQRRRAQPEGRIDTPILAGRGQRAPRSCHLSRRRRPSQAQWPLKSAKTSSRRQGVLPNDTAETVTTTNASVTGSCR
jgi:hypothetical protein